MKHELEHYRVAMWRAIKSAGTRSGMTSLHNLSVYVGMSPGSFSPTKKDNGRRWPSTETLNKVCVATRTSAAEFAAEVDGYVAEMRAQIHDPLGR